MVSKLQNYAQKVDFGLAYMKFAVVMETSKMIETPLTYQTFLGLSRVPPHERRSWGGTCDKPKKATVDTDIRKHF